ncbi:MAG: hypothetical protein CBD62_00320 [Candidatus Pelagibacter sp. TMED202]|nr:MAG: hypothetical protein CBD62_00320 [Candidatus Pelagibacter sp. TMED202]|tara:strand:+ start:1587 stop:2291 length:705 start_codon:yes stop_codon:yes gene_type:complete
MKKILIYTTNDKVISLQLVNKIVSDNKFKNYEFDIHLSKADFLRKIKILITMLFFGSLKMFIKNLNYTISIKEILKKNVNCKVINKVDENKKYDFGLSVYCSSKIKLQKFKIYNFHLGNLKNQRGSFIFFYKFIKKWKNISLSFHEISEKYDVGKVLNEKKIDLADNCKASDIFFVYLDNLNFLSESIEKIDFVEGKLYDNVEKLNLVPSFFSIFKESINQIFQKNKNINKLDT